jgi:hypothetical protein
MREAQPRIVVWFLPLLRRLGGGAGAGELENLVKKIDTVSSDWRFN